MFKEHRYITNEPVEKASKILCQNVIHPVREQVRRYVIDDLDEVLDVYDSVAQELSFFYGDMFSE